MDDGTQEIKKYIDGLPVATRQTLSAVDWYSRVNDIGKKYSLRPEQVTSLGYEILFVIIGMEDRADILSNITQALGISIIVATQIVDEINTRIFDYLLDTIRKEQSPAQTKNEPMEIEIPPIILPVVEQENSDAHAIVVEPMGKVTAPVPRYAPPVTKPAPNPVATEPTPTTAPTPPTKSSPTPLAKVPDNLPGAHEVDTATSAPDTKLASGYVADPYREPIE